MNVEINNYKDINIFNEINRLLNKILKCKCNLLYVSSPGSSPSKVYMFKDKNDNMYAVKVCDVRFSRVSLFKEVDNMKHLLPFLKEHLPKIIYIGKIKNYEIMVTQCFGIDNFYNSIISAKKPIKIYLNIWENILFELMSMWKNSINVKYSADKNPRNNVQRFLRIKTGVLGTTYNGYNINSIKNMVIQINGIEYISLEDTFNEINKIKTPDFGITCHGDPQPSNIIVSDANWYFVDWEWSGENHDLRQMFSHIYGWWATRMINQKDIPTFEVKNNKLIINYKLYKNDIVDCFQIISKNMLNSFFDLKEDDVDDINRFLSLLYLGDIRFLNIWERQYYLPILIGEAVKTICFIQNKKEKLNKNFTYNG